MSDKPIDDSRDAADESFGALDSLIKKMYYVNQDWFKVRHNLTIEQLKELFEVILKDEFILKVDDLRIKLAQYVRDIR